MWHSSQTRLGGRPGRDFSPTGASKPVRQARIPADHSFDTHPVYDLIDRATRQLHGVLHGIQSDGIVTEEEVYGLRDWLEHFHDAWPFSDAFTLVDNILEDNHVSAEELTQLHTSCVQRPERPRRSQ